MIGALVAPGDSPAAADVEVVPLVWTDCGDGLQCATATVPLDHDDPDGPTITVALARLPASRPADRIGSLFVNPGGPGGSGVDMVVNSARTFPPALRERFDIVGFDPRGVARSTPLQCFDSLEAARATRPPFPFPVGAAEEALLEAGDRALAAACAARRPAILDHMATADVARDLDRLRAAVGDDRLHYLGFSYGSYIGVTYANLFPDRVGPLVVDGVLDPVAWSTGSGDGDRVPFSTRLRSDEGAQATLAEFLRLCDEAGPSCALSGDAHDRFALLAHHLRDAPVVVPGPNGAPTTFTYANLIASTRSVLYNPASWLGHARLLAALEGAVAAAPVGDVTSAFAPPPPPGYRNALEGFAGVACSDSDNPHSFAAWSAAAAEAEAEFGYFGAPWTWASSVCAVWPGRDDDRYTGPWNAPTAAPVLVVGNYFDPATPYRGALAAADLLPNSRLLTYAGWGHVAFNKSACTQQFVVAYLVGGTLPEKGTVCPPNPSPFLATPALAALDVAPPADVDDPLWFAG